jgi:hypothetical protein
MASSSEPGVNAPGGLWRRPVDDRRQLNLLAIRRCA